MLDWYWHAVLFTLESHPQVGCDIAVSDVTWHLGGPSGSGCRALRCPPTNLCLWPHLPNRARIRPGNVFSISYCSVLARERELQPQFGLALLWVPAGCVVHSEMVLCVLFFVLIPIPELPTTAGLPPVTMPRSLKSHSCPVVMLRLNCSSDLRSVDVGIDKNNPNTIRTNWSQLIR